MFTCNRGSTLHDVQDQNTDKTHQKTTWKLYSTFDSDSLGSMQTAVALSSINLTVWKICERHKNNLLFSVYSYVLHSGTFFHISSSIFCNL